MAFRSSTTGSGTSDIPSTAVPAGVAIDDIVILAATTDLQTAIFEAADFPTGFTRFVDVDITADGQSVGVGWKRLTAADSGSYTFATLGGAAEWVCQAFAFSGRHTTNPPVISTDSINNTSLTSPVTITANGVTNVLGDDNLWISAPDVNTTGIGNGHTPPTNYTEQQDAELGFSNLSGATRDNVAAGATGTVSGTFTLTSNGSGYAAWLIRIPEGAADPAVIPSLVMAPMRATRR